ncbi:MAG: hypothetical protein KC454_02020 [Flavobacteriales bacterium]|nr:hypothetical protein [Flavobacteriales bacterium]
MASKRILKRNVNTMIFDVVEECFTVQLMDDRKMDATEKLIDEAADFQDEILTKINAAKNKADFKSLHENINAKHVDFVQKLNGLNK